MPKLYAASYVFFCFCFCFFLFECHKCLQLCGYLSECTDEKMTFTPTKSKIDQNGGKGMQRMALIFAKFHLFTPVTTW